MKKGTLADPKCRLKILKRIRKLIDNTSNNNYHMCIILYRIMDKYLVEQDVNLLNNCISDQALQYFPELYRFKPADCIGTWYISIHSTREEDLEWKKSLLTKAINDLQKQISDEKTL